jgi:hypothetical protein
VLLAYDVDVVDAIVDEVRRPPSLPSSSGGCGLDGSEIDTVTVPLWLPAVDGMFFSREEEGKAFDKYRYKTLRSSTVQYVR